MASGGHVLQQHKTNVATQLKRLVNNDLKEICRGYGKQVSGNKAELTKRCIDILDDIVARGDPTAFEDFRYRVQNRGQARPSYQSLDSPANGYGSPTPGGYVMAPGRANGTMNATQNRMPAGGKYFKQSPFYEIVDTVIPLTDLPEGPEMPQNRNTVKSSISLSVEQAQRISPAASAGQDMRLFMFCGLARDMSPYNPVDVAFPNQIEVKINNDDVKWNFKGLKNKPGSTKPCDLSNPMRFRAKANYDNQVTLTYALTSKRYAFVVYMVRYISANALTERIKTGAVIPKEKVLEEMRKANADPDIEATSTRMSLKDPISTVRITLPVRSTVCTHTQCFDGAMFMQLVEQAPQWNCPVCNKTVSFQSLCVDKYFEDILNKTPKSIEKVDVEPDGEWRMIKDEEDESQANGAGGGAGKARASYDDDFDDDLIEVVEAPNKQLNGLKRESQTPALPSPMGGPQGFSINTPPLSSREPSVAQSTVSAQRAGSKRPFGAVIDLTLSDDEDEPPRPAKRHQPAARPTQKQGTSNSSTSHPSTTSQQQQQQQQTYYNTPSSLPDSNGRYQQQAQLPPSPPPPPPAAHGFRIGQADNYRPDHSTSFRPTSQPGGLGRPARPSASPNPGAQAQFATPQYPGMNGTNGMNGGSGGSSTPGSLDSPSFQQHSLAADYGSGFAARQSATPYPQQAVQQSRPPSQLSNGNGGQTFSIRPPPSPGGDGGGGIMASPQLPQQAMYNGQQDGGVGLRLPPMQTYPSSLPPPPPPPPPPSSQQHQQYQQDGSAGGYDAYDAAGWPEWRSDRLERYNQSPG